MRSNPELDAPHRPYGLKPSVGYFILSMVMIGILVCQMVAAS